MLLLKVPDWIGRIVQLKSRFYLLYVKTVLFVNLHSITNMKKINNGLVIGKGFEIHVPDIHQVKYVSGQHSGTLEIEGGGTGKNIYWSIYKSSLSGDDFDSEIFFINNRATILRQISEALILLGMPNEIE